MIRLEELREELGSEFTLAGDEEQVRVLDKGGFDVTFIDLDSGIAEHEISVKWHFGKDARQPTAASQAHAAIDGELQKVWEDAGFAVSDSGSMGEYWQKNEPGTRFPVYKVEVTKEVGNAKEAADAVRWIHYADDTTWL